MSKPTSRLRAMFDSEAVICKLSPRGTVRVQRLGSCTPLRRRFSLPHSSIRGKAASRPSAPQLQGISPHQGVQ